MAMTFMVFPVLGIIVFIGLYNSDIIVKKIRNIGVAVCAAIIVVCVIVTICDFSTHNGNSQTNKYKSDSPAKWKDQDGNIYTDQNGDGEYGFSDYLKEQDPDLYENIKDRYENLQ